MPPKNNKQLVELDGRTLEGGGQLIRTALCLSALTGTPLKIDHIRGNRSGGGGLKAQHLACVKWLAHASNAYVEGAEKGSKTLLFQPRIIESELSPAFTKQRLPDGNHIYECHLAIGTAGSTGLALQAILPYILFTKLPSQLPIHLRLSGGTNVSGSPSYEYISQVLLPTLHQLGFPQIKAQLEKRGWSQGGASIGTFTLEIPPRQHLSLPAFKHRPDNLSAPTPLPAHLQAIFIGPQTSLAHLQSIITPAIHHHFNPTYTPESSTLDITTEPSLHPKRLAFILIASAPDGKYTLARDWLYDKKIHSLDRATVHVVDTVTRDLEREWRSGAWVDEHMRDQVVVFQALAVGEGEVWAGWDDGEGRVGREPSLHARTVEWVVRQMVGVRFGSEGGCEGLGFGVEEEEDDEAVGAMDRLDVGGGGVGDGREVGTVS